MESRTYTLKDGSQFKEEDVFHFVNGIPGFENLHRFVLSSTPGQEPFHWLNSVDDPDIRFVIINPMEFDPDYSPKFQKSQGEELKIERREDMLIFVIVTIADHFPDSTANMAGPLVLNVSNRRGKQIILDDPRYSVRHAFMKGGQ